jgi:hypothetical protein
MYAICYIGALVFYKISKMKQGSKMKKKYRVLETITTVDGTLYKDELVTFENEEDDGDWRVKDNMGRIWFVDSKKLSNSPVALSKEK